MYAYHITLIDQHIALQRWSVLSRTKRISHLSKLATYIVFPNPTEIIKLQLKGNIWWILVV